MHREYHKWYSPSLQRDMELLIYGHGGARVLVFPTSKGRFYEWPDRGMMNVVGDYIDRGHLQMYFVDSVDEESWYNWRAHPGYRAWRHHLYCEYLKNEVMPLSWSKNQTPYVITVGASFGAFHAMSFGLKYPEIVGRILAFSGFFDIRRFTDGYSDDMVYSYNPMQFIGGEHEHHRLEALRRTDIIMAVGRDDRLLEHSRQLSGLLWSKGIGNALREWDGWSHDWPYWERMLRAYIGGHD